MHEQHVAQFWRVVGVLRINLSAHQHQTLTTCVGILIDRAYEEGAADQSLMELAGREQFIRDLRTADKLAGEANR